MKRLESTLRPLFLCIGSHSHSRDRYAFTATVIAPPPVELRRVERRPASTSVWVDAILLWDCRIGRVGAPGEDTGPVGWRLCLTEGEFRDIVTAVVSVGQQLHAPYPVCRAPRLRRAWPEQARPGRGTQKSAKGQVNDDDPPNAPSFPAPPTRETHPGRPWQRTVHAECRAKYASADGIHGCHSGRSSSTCFRRRRYSSKALRPAAVSRRLVLGRRPLKRFSTSR